MSFGHISSTFLISSEKTYVFSLWVLIRGAMLRLMRSHNKCFPGKISKKYYMATPYYVELCCYLVIVSFYVCIIVITRNTGSP